MSNPMSLDERIGRLAPGVDSSIREELQFILRALRLAEHPTGAIQIVSRPALWLFQRIYAAAGKTDRIRPPRPPETP